MSQSDLATGLLKVMRVWRSTMVSVLLC